MREFDCIVLGLGGVGSSALLEATRANWKVLGLDQFPIAHAFGSSHGNTRIFRTAYFEHPSYVPLAIEAIEKWKHLEEQTGQKLMTRNGLLQIGPANGQVIEGILTSASEHELPIDVLNPGQSRERFPQFTIANSELAVLERSAGYLFVERCISAQVKLAISAGAQVDDNAKNVRWETIGNDMIKVFSSGDTYVTRKLIVAAGAWSSLVLDEFRLPLRIKRKSQFWFSASGSDLRVAESLPTFFFETAKGCFYGFPSINSVGMKIAEHTLGNPVDDPYRVDREINNDELERVKSFVADRLPGLQLVLRDHSVCMYTMSPDEHFIVDRHDQLPGVVFAAGLSGHGFKFTPVLGHYLVRLLNNDLDSRMAFLKMNRTGLTRTLENR